MVPADSPQRGGERAALAPLLVTPGDRFGIGPEIAAKALARRVPGSRPVVLLGHEDSIRAALVRQGIEADVVNAPDDAEPAEIAAVRMAVERLQRGDGVALVTGPIHKARMVARGFRHAGHTELLGELCGVERPVMAFVGGQTKVCLVTVHHALKDVPGLLTVERITHVLSVAWRAMCDDLHVEKPVLRVCGLNPHAGEAGLLGSEERDVIGPAVEAARDLGIDARGPMSAETAFSTAGDGDMVVAMYHDQGLVPLKYVDRGRTVNWTLGLPIVRTSVDHGTADDIAGKWIAESSSMEAAIGWAETLVGRR